MDSTDLAARARAAYERGRLQRALLEALWLGPLVAFALWRCRSLSATCVASLVLLGLAIALRWRGGVWGRAVLPSVLVSLPAVVVPALLCDAMGACAPGSMAWCFAICPAAGLVAGALLGSWAARQGEDRGRALLAGAAIVLACGTLGCAVFGVAGVAAMWLGALASGPVLLWARAR